MFPTVSSLKKLKDSARIFLGNNSSDLYRARSRVGSEALTNAVRWDSVAGVAGVEGLAGISAFLAVEWDQRSSCD